MEINWEQWIPWFPNYHMNPLLFRILTCVLFLSALSDHKSNTTDMWLEYCSKQSQDGFFKQTKGWGPRIIHISRWICNIHCLRCLRLGIQSETLNVVASERILCKTLLVIKSREIRWMARRATTLRPIRDDRC